MRNGAALTVPTKEGAKPAEWPRQDKSQVMDVPSLDANDLASTLTAIRQASGTSCSRPDPIFPTHVICLELEALGLIVFAKHVVHPERSAKNGVSTQPFPAEESPG